MPFDECHILFKSAIHKKMSLEDFGKKQTSILRKIILLLVLIIKNYLQQFIENTFHSLQHFLKYCTF